MKIVHTSDWHIGRRWKGIRRLDEMERVLEHLLSFIEARGVELVLHSGDLFDTRNAPADAEHLANRFFVRLKKLGVEMVVVAGNHDDPSRFEARAMLAEYAGVHLLGRPRRAHEGGVIPIEAKSGARAIVAALPFASPGAWVSALDLAGEEADARGKYARMFKLACDHLCESFTKKENRDAIKLVVSHTHIHGAHFGDSERRVHVGEEWAATTQCLPTTANYIALGHIHKAQRLDGLLPAYYAGSPLQLDFGEAGQQKTFNYIEAEGDRPPVVEAIPYQGGKELIDLRVTLEELESSAERHRDAGWLRVTVPLAAQDPNINRKVRKLLPNALVVRVELPQQEVVDSARPGAGAAPEAHFRAYHMRYHQRQPEPTIVEAFNSLHKEAEERTPQN